MPDPQSHSRPRFEFESYGGEIPIHLIASMLIGARVGHRIELEVLRYLCAERRLNTLANDTHGRDRFGYGEDVFCNLPGTWEETLCEEGRSADRISSCFRAFEKNSNELPHLKTVLAQESLRLEGFQKPFWAPAPLADRSQTLEFKIGREVRTWVNRVEQSGSADQATELALYIRTVVGVAARAFTYENDDESECHQKQTMHLSLVAQTNKAEDAYLAFKRSESTVDELIHAIGLSRAALEAVNMRKFYPARGRQLAKTQIDGVFGDHTPLRKLIKIALTLTMQNNTCEKKTFESLLQLFSTLVGLECAHGDSEFGLRRAELLAEASAELEYVVRLWVLRLDGGQAGIEQVALRIADSLSGLAASCSETSPLQLNVAPLSPRSLASWIVGSGVSWEVHVALGQFLSDLALVEPLVSLASSRDRLFPLLASIEGAWLEFLVVGNYDHSQVVLIETILDAARFFRMLRVESEETLLVSLPPIQIKKRSGVAANVGRVQRTPYPRVVLPNKDGPFESHFEEGQLHMRGHMSDEKPDGIWETFYKDGTKKSSVSFVKGQRHGGEEHWHANGQLQAKGPTVSGESDGVWIYFNKNGTDHATIEYDMGKKVGPVQYQDEHGLTFFEGTYKEDFQVGEWIRRYADGQTHSIEGFDDDGKLVYSEHYWPNGQLKRTGQPLYNGYGPGTYEEYEEDGTPVKRFVASEAGVRIKEWSWEDGREKVQEFVDGVPKELAEGGEVLSKIAEAVNQHEARETDGNIAFAHSVDELLDKWTKDRRVNNHLGYMLWKRGLIDIAPHPHLHKFLWSDNMTGEDLMRFLHSAVPESGLWEPIRRWPMYLDRLVAATYAKDPKPFKAWRELPTDMRHGVAFVLARFGEDVSDVMPELSNLVADGFVRGHVDKIYTWPTKTRNGWDLTQKFTNGFSGRALRYTSELEELFGGDGWGRSLVEAALVADATKTPLELRYFDAGFKAASLGELRCILDKAAPSNDTLRRVFLELRDDPADEVAKLAQNHKDPELASRLACVAAILSGRQEVTLSPEVLDAMSYELQTPEVDTSGISVTRNDFFDFIEARYNFWEDDTRGKEPFYPKDTLTFDAMRALPGDVRKCVLIDLLEEDPNMAAPFLHLVSDAEFWRDALARIEEAPHPNLRFALGHLPVEALPLLEACYQRAEFQEQRDVFVGGIVSVMARAASKGEAWDARFDKYLIPAMSLNPSTHFTPIISKALCHMDLQRNETLLLSGLDPRAEHFANVFAYVCFAPTEKVLRRGFEGVLDTQDQGTAWETHVSYGITRLPNGKEWRDWLLENGCERFNNLFAISNKQMQEMMRRRNGQ